MKDLTLNELLTACENPITPYGIDKNAVIYPMPFCYDFNENSVLFLSDKVGNEERETELQFLKKKPPFAIITSYDKIITSCPCPIIRTKDVRGALSRALSLLYEIDYSKIKFIGVTGTNGKTTTATIIYEILSHCGYKTGFIGTGKIISCAQLLTSPTYSMTTPDPSVLYPAIRRMADDGCEFIVMEVSSHSIALGKVEPICFEYAIFTNLDSDHLDFHKTKEEYFLTKLKLFSKTKTGLFNLDDEYCKRAYHLAECKKLTFGVIERGDVFATDVVLKSLNESTFFYREKDLIFKAHTNLGGAFNVYNVLAALKCVIDLGIKPCIAKSALKGIGGVEGRMEVIRGKVTAIIDYAHTPMAFYNCLKTVKSDINQKQSLIVVFGCGGNRDREKRPLFGKYAELLADKVIITEDNSRNESFDTIAKDITSGMKLQDCEIIKDRESAIKYAFKIANEGDVIAIIGKGHERYKIVEDQYIPLDERQIINGIINSVGGAI